MSGGQEDGTPLDRLYARVGERIAADPALSYTASLAAEGVPRVAQKLGEEAVETVIAAVERDPAAIVTESADLLFHLMVLWRIAGVEPRQVWDELARREQSSGHEEKASRTGRT